MLDSRRSLSLRRSLRASAAGALLAFAACHFDLIDAIEGGTDPDADITGEWAFTSTVPCGQGDVCPGAYGSLVLSISRDVLGGSAYLLRDPILGAAEQLSGAKGGADFTLYLGSCSLSGTVYDGGHTHLVGEFHCPTYSGSWRAKRTWPPVTLTLSPAARTTVSGATFALTATITDAAGSWLGRHLTWSSDNLSAATVSASGLVTMGDSGTATITVAAPDVSATVMVRSLGLVRFTSVSAGGSYACAIASDGRPLCWGSGALGDAVAYTVSGAPVAVAGGQAWTALSAGADQACGLATGGAPYCWGQFWGWAPYPVAGLFTLATISSGDRHACGLDASGAALCWGSNQRGQLGHGNVVDSQVPSPASGGHTFTTLSAGRVHTCAVATDGTAWCWGDNQYGQLGIALPDTMRLVPTAVAGGLRFASASAGGSHTCALTLDGAAWCWGSNYNGQLGTGTTTPSGSPTPVTGGHTFRQLSAGEFGTCGVTPDGTAWCWGNDADPAPTPVPGSLAFASVSAGAWSACGLATDSIVYCWTYGGDPVRVPGQR